MAVQEYKCPCCAGAIEFNSQLQKMKCPYCETEFDMDTLLAYDEDLSTDGNDELDWNPEASEWQEGETDNMRVYTCQSCGGEIIGDETLGATKCPYCDNPVVMTGQFRGNLKPDYVIPFKLDKNAAVEGFKKHLVGKKFLPKVFKDQNHLDEVKGLYVPCWLFDADADGGVRYKCTRTHSHTSGNYRITETSYYSVYREGTMSFDNIPVDGSTKMPDDLMESVGPFDFKDAVPFQTAYLAGYLADKYDVSADDSTERATVRAKESVDDAFRKTVSGYSSVTKEGDNLRLKQAKAKYALYPVWVLTTSWNGQTFLFGMNGQTGKFVGNLPCDPKAFWRTFWLTAIVSAIAIFGVGYLFFR
ncbi:MAG: hypothetical protein J5582_12150 [Ruminococcus sp.]|uniref:hypothetical protein n=1 Tax=Ruminococcus sp. TaxID=41978 RepID=UPI0025EBD25D|nr:hypothetical protein [Ruminococcus sp.]MBO4867288.1 hypothetical protein [Ruminococcus sp.]